MQKIKFLLVSICLLCLPCTPAKAIGEDIPFLVELIVQSSAMVTQCKQVYETIDAMKEEVMNVIEVANAVANMYQSSQELTDATDQILKIYTTYLETLSYISKKQLYLTNMQIETLIQTMDAAAFNIPADATSRPKGIKRAAGGALENLPLLTSMMGSSQGSVMDFINLMDATSRKVQSSLRKTQAASRYCRSVIRQAEIHSGVYNIEEAIDDFERKYKK